MCINVPVQIKAVNKNNYVLQYGAQEIKVKNSLIKDSAEGDWVLVQNKCIVQKISNQQAQDFFKLINKK